MPKAPDFPLTVRDRSATVKIYRIGAETTKSKFSYVLAWVGSNGRERRTFADLTEAKAEANLKAGQLADGVADSMHMSRSDAVELAEARELVASAGMPLLSAVSEWVKARELAGAAVLEACTAWSERRTSTITRIKVGAAIDVFLADKEAAKKKSRTYESKLRPAREYFGDVYLDTITASMWAKYLHRFDDAVTRNDMRKRAVTLCRWARRHGHLADGLVPEVEKTERAKETAQPIGILTPETYHRLLHHFREHHPNHLAALVLAGLCGVRSDEIHGKRDDRDRRQVWEDIHLGRKFISVTVAKENTPSNRVVHLSPAAVAWLQACPGERKGPVCVPGAMERVREIGITAGFNLPENCFRHSWITYRIALTGNKHETSTEAGNSVKEIDRRYRVPRPKADGVRWFATRPEIPVPTDVPAGGAKPRRRRARSESRDGSAAPEAVLTPVPSA